MQLAETAHTARPWRIHELAPDFRLEDVWELPIRGAPDDFPRLVEMVAAGDPARRSPPLVRALFAIRAKFGDLLGWDDPVTDVPMVRDRLPADLRETPAPGFDALPFDSLYLIEDEFAAEVANRTMHGILHLGWVPEDDGRCRGQFAVLVKPSGRLGTAYMAAIRPFRHLVVYPALLRQWERAWQRRVASR